MSDSMHCFDISSTAILLTPPIVVKRIVISPPTSFPFPLSSPLDRLLYNRESRFLGPLFARQGQEDDSFFAPAHAHLFTKIETPQVRPEDFSYFLPPSSFTIGYFFPQLTRMILDL